MTTETEIREWERLADAALLSLMMDGVATAKNFGRPLEAGKGKEKDSPLDFLEGMEPCQYLSFGILISRTVRYWCELF